MDLKCKSLKMNSFKLRFLVVDKMNDYTPEGVPTRYLILKWMLGYLKTTENPTDEWKESYIDFVETIVEPFLDPDTIHPSNQTAEFKKLLNETSQLSAYLYHQIHSKATFDAKVFEIVGHNFLKICDICVKDRELDSLFEKMDCSDTTE